MSAPVDHAFVHHTVLRAEVVAAIAPREGGRYLDVTLGGGGHSEGLLTAAPKATLVGIDRDETAIAAAGARLSPFAGHVRILHGAFADATSLLRDAGEAGGFDGLVADLGVSSPQLDDASRGMSFRRDASAAPIDMRMDRSHGETARELIDRCTDTELADLIFELGEERRSRRIASSIKRAATEGKLETTGDLRHAIWSAVGGKGDVGIDPATRTFQALRIAVNDELGQLDRLLADLPTLVAEGGVAAIISFHSLEDGRVKRAFAGERWALLQRKPMVAGEAELTDNPRARSAKLRAAKLLAPGAPKNDREARYAARRAKKYGGAS